VSLRRSVADADAVVEPPTVDSVHLDSRVAVVRSGFGVADGGGAMVAVTAVLARDVLGSESRLLASASASATISDVRRESRQQVPR
jgi:hypothetical protein